jgi:hypothetical protein
MPSGTAATSNAADSSSTLFRGHHLEVSTAYSEFCSLTERYGRVGASLTTARDYTTVFRIRVMALQCNRT